MGSLRASLTELSSTLRIADVVDVVVVTVFVYFAISWFRQARSRFVIGGLATLALLYLVARLLDMYLTLLIFQALITVALVAVVVIFQEDIRRGFERLALRGRLKSEAKAHGRTEIVDATVAALSELANRRIGALMVFRGREPLERHVTGGVPLDGRLSEPLLYSIFDPHSAGHDGAAVVEGGLVRMFAVHLPLSTRGPAELGTRHTAAIGLSERSDALVVVVSEERGTISIASQGELRVISPSELKSRLDAFLRELTPQKPQALWQRLLVANFGTKVLALLITVGTWVLLFGPQRETVARSFDVPVVYRDVPDGFIVDEPIPLTVRVTVSGPSRAFEALDPSELAASLDVAEVSAGARKEDVAPTSIDLPRQLSVSRIEPRTVTVVAHPTKPVELPVRPATAGKLPPKLALAGVSASPEKVQAAVQRSELGRITGLSTEPVDLSRIDKSTTLTRALIVPKGVRLPPGAPREVSVSVEIAPK